MKELINRYTDNLKKIIDDSDWQPVEVLADTLVTAIKNKQRVYFCGNGGSAGNAVHLANDFLYGIEPNGGAMRVEALPANSAVITCLGNDIGYENIFSQQLKVKADAGDVLVVLSGSGNSPNILNALEEGNRIGMHTFAILGYSGGKAKDIAKTPIHFAINDMQISEDLQLIVGHMLMQHLHTVLKD